MHFFSVGWQIPEEVFLDPQTGYLAARVDSRNYGDYSQAVIYQGKVFQPKTELHVSIVSGSAADRLCETAEMNPAIVELIRGWIRTVDWRFLPLDRFYAVQDEEENESIVQMVNMPGVAGFFQRLSDLLQQPLPLPPTHVTLFTCGDPQGIGLPDRETFDRLVKAEVLPEAIQVVIQNEGEKPENDRSIDL